MTGGKYRIIMGLLAGLFLFTWAFVITGCGSGNGNEAQAAGVWRIETYVVEDNSFFIRSDIDPPLIEVKDSATEYTLQSDGDVTFTILGGVARTIVLVKDEKVIERPVSQTVTVIFER